MTEATGVHQKLNNSWGKFLLSIAVLFIAVIANLTYAQAAYTGDDFEIPDRVKVGPLDAIVIENSPGAPYVVYLHGYGGSAEDAFADLQPELSKNKDMKKFNWIFPDCPPGGWFDIAAILDSVGTPNYERWQATLPPTRTLLGKMIESAKIDPRNIIWGGFSQGAITAADYVLHAKVPPLGLVVNSGIYFPSTDWQRVNKNLSGVPFFMSHDKNDESLPFAEAKKLEELLFKNGMLGKMKTHTKDHTVPHTFLPQVLRDLIEGRQRSALSMCGGIL